MSMTYNSLVSLVTSYLDRTDSSTLDRIPDFIGLAESRISNDSKNLGFVQYVTGSFVATESVIAKPARWNRTMSFRFGTGTPQNFSNQLYLRSYDYCRLFWPDDTLTDVPVYYADYDYNHWLIVPTPDDSYPYEIAYLQSPEPLTAVNQTNWLTNYAPHLILYATLLEAAPYLKNDDRISVWQDRYDRALAGIEKEDAERKVDRASNRDAN